MLRERFPDLVEAPIADRPFVRWCLTQVAAAAHLDTQLVPRGFLGLGLSRDHVFYDSSERVVAAFREFLD